MNNSFYGRQIESFQALRGIAALMIIAEHVKFLQCGLFAVDIFFVLSGFMIIYSTENGMKHFLTKRIIRIVPFYWLVTLVTFAGVKLVPGAFASTRGGVKELLLSLFFVPFDMNTGNVFEALEGYAVMQPLMRIGWTLNMEMLFYVLFYVAAKISYKYRALITTGFLIILFTIGLYSKAPIMVLWGSVMLFEFSFGMGLCYLCKHISEKNISRGMSVISGATAVIIIIVLAVMRHMNLFVYVNRLLLWGFPAAIIVLFTYMYNENCKVPTFLVWAGDISFSIYYMHYYIVQFMDRYVLDMSVASVKAFAGLALSVFITMLASYITWVLIEKKLTSYLKSTFVK